MLSDEAGIEMLALLLWSLVLSRAGSILHEPWMGLRRSRRMTADLAGRERWGDAELVECMRSYCWYM